ncbi:prolyl-tRNA editing enzyme YbaK/EbsC (Cys-tRNA(Pro) deacylase) [Kineothrix alysoides]|uniref:Prolyl-tRNA editing enzyme YbaK/EbsC (Cys-tRNA(Pro) deacylase) n=1 Tax=Kineothrix alysoides TaxID=1469948 RepID=A0A4R1QVS2_9FIRM|nr:YbaK/EbsC family protein [Kineothrix alysoides]TCL57241.1 prolyl-tRNA editing enzyme YbaK/EbsC (Cys-tRNA(Pro) deacylase) [Kineothrix alysoides]
MSVENVKEYLKPFGLDDKVKEFQVSSATVELAAAAAGVIPARIAKTLSFKTGESAILIVTSGDAKVDNKKYKAIFGKKAKMLTPEEVITYTGHAVGGVCPFDIPDESVEVYLDVSMKRFETVLPAAGSASSCVVLTPDELERASHAKEWIDICTLI